LDKWLPAVWLIANCKNGISSYELAKDLGIQQMSACFMLHRIRLAMQHGSIEKLPGEVEVDENFIGGKARNMHKGKRAEKIRGRGSSGKVAVMGRLGRHGKVQTQIPRTSHSLWPCRYGLYATLPDRLPVGKDIRGRVGG
jgi:hypothetical protein